jgi:hypothetical protein
VWGELAAAGEGGGRRVAAARRFARRTPERWRRWWGGGGDLDVGLDVCEDLARLHSALYLLRLLAQPALLELLVQLLFESHLLALARGGPSGLGL